MRGTSSAWSFSLSLYYWFSFLPVFVPIVRQTDTQIIVFEFESEYRFCCKWVFTGRWTQCSKLGIFGVVRVSADAAVVHTTAHDRTTTWQPVRGVAHIWVGKKTRKTPHFQRNREIDNRSQKRHFFCPMNSVCVTTKSVTNGQNVSNNRIGPLGRRSGSQIRPLILSDRFW